MKWLFAALAALLVSVPAHAQRVYSQAELDALLAPIALQPDGVLSQVLMAATYPDEVAAAARWSRANPQLRGDQAVRAVEGEPWDPSVKALVAFPDLLARMEESPQWLRELGEAFLQQQAQVMDTVQSLRRRAQATGQLSSNEQTSVYTQGEAIVVEPRTQIVYVRYYDPYVVYGPWWWPAYRPVFWRPWAPRPVFVATGFFYSRPNWQQRHVQVVHRPVHVRTYPQHVAPGQWQHRPQTLGQAVNHAADRAATQSTRPYQRVPESQRRPIVQQHMPAASGFSRPQHQQQPRTQMRRQGDGREQRPQFNQHQQRGNQGGSQGGHQGRGGGRG
jgi:hypothetical protein